MAVTNNEVFDRWERCVIEGEWPTGKSGRRLSMDGNSVLADEDAIYSYGRHFSMAVVLRTRKGKPRSILVNGDRWGNVTAGHQSQARGSVSRICDALGIPSLIVPFSALESAGINRASIEPIEVRPDRNEVFHHKSADPPGTRHPTMDDPSGATVPQEGWDYTKSPPERVTRQVPAQVPDPDRVYVGRSNYTVAQRDPAGESDERMWRWETTRHWLGDSCFRAEVTERVTVQPTDEQVRLHNLIRALAAREHALRRTIEAEERIQWRYDHDRDGEPHWSGWDVPRSPEMLDPLREEVAALDDRIRGLSRDLDASLPDGTWRSTRHSNLYDGALMLQTTRTRRPYFLSSFDYQEARPLYFLCELPRGRRPTSVEHAYELLKPARVVLAEEQGRECTRQGDVFAIPMPELTTRAIKAMLRRGERIVKRRHMVETEHSATEVALCRGGTTFARGTMYHDVSGWREHDHARRRMGDGKTWHMIVRNTVPRAVA